MREVTRSHVNLVIADTRQWEQAAAFILDTHPRVEAFVKNADLGFGIPYLNNGQMHDYDAALSSSIQGYARYNRHSGNEGIRSSCRIECECSSGGLAWSMPKEAVACGDMR